MVKNHLSILLVISLIFAAVARLFIVSLYEIHWDEFIFLYKVYEHGSGALQTVFQTIHVHAFKWLPLVSQNEANQIIAARVVMLFFQAATVFYIFRIAKEFVSCNASLFAALSYLSFTYVLRQGTSFRADPIAVCLLMACIYIILIRSGSYVSAFAAAFLFALSIMVTIKSLTFLPTIILLAWAKKMGVGRRGLFKHLSILAIATLVGLAALYLLHSLTMPPKPAGDAVKMLSNSYSKVILLENLFPGRKYLVNSLGKNIPFWLFAAVGFIPAVFRMRGISTANKRVEAIMLIALALPVFSIIFYRNAFPYYYVFVLAPAGILCGAGWDRLMKMQWPALSRVIAVIAIGSCLLNINQNGIIRPQRHSLLKQKEFLEVIHNLFPEPVPYIDRCGMVSSFPWAGFFMSTWGLEGYHKNGIPLLSEKMRDLQPKFMIANIAQLDYAKTYYSRKVAEGYGLMDEDLTALKKHYYPFWGPLYIAGKQFTFQKEGQSIRFDIVIEGNYSIEGKGITNIDGKYFKPGDAAYLKQGPHSIASQNGTGSITLAWGVNRHTPLMPPPAAPLFKGY